jgi:hypothetical protein
MAEYRTVEYRTYTNIRQRCLNPKSPAFASYGGKGVGCSWQSYDEFLADLGRRPRRAGDAASSVLLARVRLLSLTPPRRAGDRALPQLRGAAGRLS